MILREASALDGSIEISSWAERAAVPKALLNLKQSYLRSKYFSVRN
jgi:hypothetical protein